MAPSSQARISDPVVGWMSAVFHFDPEPGSMPTHNGLRFYDTNRLKNRRSQPIGPDENQSIDRTEVQAAWRSSLQDGQLMPENQKLGIEPRPRFEPRCNKTEDEAHGVDHSVPI